MSQVKGSRRNNQELIRSIICCLCLQNIARRLRTGGQQSAEVTMRKGMYLFTFVFYKFCAQTAIHLFSWQPTPKFCKKEVQIYPERIMLKRCTPMLLSTRFVVMPLVFLSTRIHFHNDSHKNVKIFQKWQTFPHDMEIQYLSLLEISRPTPDSYKRTNSIYLLICTSVFWLW